MSLHSIPLTLGRLTLTVYDFDEPGDTLPMRDHTAENVHITVVARGRVAVNGTPMDTGRVLDFEPGNPHEFVALEPNTRIVNIVKGVA